MEQGKNEIRKHMLNLRNQLSKEERKKKSQKIKNVLCKSEEYQKAFWIFTYLNMGSEVETISLIEQAWKDGKKTAVPIAIKGSREMYFVEIMHFEGMKRSEFGVLEPQAGREQEVEPQKDTLFIIPGSVFDEKGNRFGYGGGYYDTYLQRFSDKKRIALAYDFQILDKIPVEIHDKPMDFVITENRIIIGGERK